MNNVESYEGKFLETINDLWFKELVGEIKTGISWSEQAVKMFAGEKYKYGNHYGVVLYKENGFVFGVEFGTVLGYRDAQDGFMVLRKRRPINECSPFVVSQEKPTSKMKGKEFPKTNAPPLVSSAANNDGEQTLIEDNIND